MVEAMLLNVRCFTGVKDEVRIGKPVASGYA